MSTKSRIWFFIGLLGLLGVESFAQGGYQIGALPSLNANIRGKNYWSYNAKIESRQVFRRVSGNGEMQDGVGYVLSDFSFLAARKFGLASRLAGGYLIRIEGGKLQHRFIQQWVVVQRFTGFRLAHRFLSDQSFSATEKPELRLRYRVSSEIPLNGESLDPGEWYLKLSNEYVYSMQLSSHDLEIRFLPFIGFNLVQDLKVETGIDYRLSSFLNEDSRHTYWLALSFFFDI